MLLSPHGTRINPKKLHIIMGGTFKRIDSFFLEQCQLSLNIYIGLTSLGSSVAQFESKQVKKGQMVLPRISSTLKEGKVDS